jgi:hypothetical protein
MSGSGEYTTTPNLGLYKPTYNADAENWGFHLNSNSDVLDAAFGGSTVGPFLPLSGGLVTGQLAIDTAPVMSGSSGTTPVSFHNNLNVSGVAPVGMQPFNKIGVSDSVDVMSNNPGTSVDGGSANALWVIHNISGAATGQRAALLSQFNLTSAVNLGTNAFLSAFVADATSAYNCGGTSGAPSGSLCGFSYQTSLNAGATHWNLAEGFEGGCTVDPAASCSFANGAKITLTGRGINTSNILTLNYGGTGTAGTRPMMGIAIQSWESPRWPIDPAGTIMGTQNHGTDPSTAAFGIDFQAVTFSTAAFRSPGFLVDGRGALTLTPANGITALQIQCNQNAVLPSISFGAAITFDFSSGFGECNFFNVYPSAARSFEWHQMTSASAATSLMTLTPAGVLATTAMQIGGGSGPTWTTGSGVPSSTQPVGSLYSRVSTWAAGATLYVSKGGGAWTAVASV